MEHSGLMHGILAVAALHRSYLDSGGHNRYRSAAIRHQNLSLPYLRSLINNASAENCDALFTLSTFVVLFVFALPQSPIAPANFDPFKEMIRLIGLVKGVFTVVEMAKEWLLQGPLRTLLLESVWEIQLAVPEEIGDALNCLILRNDMLPQSDSKRTTYGRAIEIMRRTFELLMLNPDDHGMGWFWVAIMERQYVDFLRAKEPMALVLLAHFGVALHASRSYWWAGNWGRQLVQAIHDMLDDDWRPWIQWPLVCVGLWTDTPSTEPCSLPLSPIERLFHDPKLPVDQASFSRLSRFSCDRSVGH